MATIRISPTEVQLGTTIYTFEDADIADDFEACVATVSLKYCEQEHPAVNKRIADSNHQGN
jgi:hypothetical protein